MTTSLAHSRHDPAGTDPKTAPPKPVRGRPVGDREAKRTELLQAGIRVIAEEGYSGASLRKVAKEAGHTTGAISYYFADKEDMMRAIVDYMFDRFDTTLDVGESLDDLSALFHHWIELNSNPEGWLAGFQLVAHARHEPVLARVYQERYASYRERFAAMLSRMQAEGKVRTDISAALLADDLGAIADGWSLMLPIEPERFAPEAVAALIDSIIVMLRPHPLANGR